MRRHRRAKIVATVGPASSSPEMLKKLFLCGVDTFRLNFSHGSHEDHAKVHAAIRALEAELACPIGILQDLQGPKIRVGTIKGGKISVAAGDEIRFVPEGSDGDSLSIPLRHPEIFAAVMPGHDLLIDDGRIRVHVTRASADAIDAKVIYGGVISNRKGVNLPDTVLDLSPLTPKDRADLAFGLELGMDWVALSFVQKPSDVIEAKALIGDRAGLVAKIEKPTALDHIEDILRISDAIMVARGDLGVEMPIERVPGLQKTITRMARKVGKPVVVATQMLESMITTPVPTRAEVSDVATAVFEGADAVMLSAESASGQFPIEAVTMMNRIAETVESEAIYPSVLLSQRPEPEATGADAIAEATRDVAEVLGAKVIAAWTSSGATCLRIARERPSSSILAMTPIVEIARQLALVWGLHPVVTDDARDERDMADRACRHAFIEGFAGVGERVLVVAGVPFGTPGSTNNLRIAVVGPDGGVG